MPRVFSREERLDETMELKQLQYYVVSVDMGSFANAAKMLFTTQPHVSRTVKSLEDELQVQLLSREARGVRMTDEGKKVYEYASSILKNTDLIERINKENKSRKLTIATMPAARISDLVAEFVCKKGGEDDTERLQVSVREGSMEEIMGFLHKHVAELCFCYVSDTQMPALEQTLEYKRLEYVPITEGKMAVMVGEKHPLYEAAEIPRQWLKQLAFVQYEEDYFSLTKHLGHINENLHHYGQVENVVTTNSSVVLRQMVAHGKLAHLTCDRLQDDAKPGCRFIPITDAQDTVHFGYIKRIRSEVSDIGMELVEYLKSALR